MKEKWFFVLKTVMFLVFSLALLGTVIAFLGKEKHFFKKTFVLKTRFQSVAGLSLESPVYRYGLRVGSVDEFRFMPDGKVEVVMRIEEKFHNQFRQGCYARIVPVGILGDKAIDVVGGKLEGAILPAGSIITSTEPFDLNDLAERVKPLLKDVSTIAHNLASITSDIQQEHETYRQIIHNVAVITESIAKGEGTLGKLVKKDDLYQEFDLTLKQAQTAMEKINKIADTLQKCSQDLYPVVTEVKRAAENLTVLLENIDDFICKLDRWSQKAEAIINDFSYASQQIRRASTDLPIVTSNLCKASEGAVEVIEAAKKNWLIRRYLRKQEKEQEKRHLKEKLPWEDSSKRWWE
jgi:phospholipid/cholesterol/gamma-HCH transport system substrate-binding protein